MKIKIGISSCLLGEPVRYDGGHKLDHYLKNTLGQFVEWISVCPEVESGLSVPREAMRLIKFGNEVRIVTINTKKDYTEQILKWSEEKLKSLEKLNISGFIFKSRSPSSGLMSAKIYSENGKLLGKGQGIFAKAFVNYFPEIPVEEDGRLQNPLLRENFIERVFIYSMWQELKNSNMNYKKLIEFHTKIKLTLMAHSSKHYTELGRLVAEGKKDKDIFNKYFSKLMEGLTLKATISKNTNVLYHIIGYFKKLLTSDEKKELLEIIENYRKGYIPLIVPITMINHYVKKYRIEYLLNQYYLNPHPVELMLRNHV